MFLTNSTQRSVEIMWYSIKREFWRTRKLVIPSIDQRIDIVPVHSRIRRFCRTNHWQFELISLYTAEADRRQIFSTHYPKKKLLTLNEKSIMLAVGRKIYVWNRRVMRRSYFTYSIRKNLQSFCWNGECESAVSNCRKRVFSIPLDEDKFHPATEFSPVTPSEV